MVRAKNTATSVHLPSTAESKKLSSAAAIDGGVKKNSSSSSAETKQKKQKKPRNPDAKLFNILEKDDEGKFKRTEHNFYNTSGQGAAAKAAIRGMTNIYVQKVKTYGLDPIRVYLGSKEEYEQKNSADSESAEKCANFCKTYNLRYYGKAVFQGLEYPIPKNIAAKYKKVVQIMKTYYEDVLKKRFPAPDFITGENTALFVRLMKDKEKPCFPFYTPELEQAPAAEDEESSDASEDGGEKKKRKKKKPVEYKINLTQRTVTVVKSDEEKKKEAAEKKKKAAAVVVKAKSSGGKKKKSPQQQQEEKPAKATKKRKRDDDDSADEAPKKKPAVAKKEEKTSSKKQPAAVEPKKKSSPKKAEVAKEEKQPKKVSAANVVNDSKKAKGQ